MNKMGVNKIFSPKEKCDGKGEGENCIGENASVDEKLQEDKYLGTFRVFR